MPAYTHFTNAYLVLPSGDLTPTPTSLLICDGKILEVGGALSGSSTDDVTVVDLQGAILAPGLIDIQINGAFGFDFSEYGHYDSQEAEETAYLAGVEKVGKGLATTGVSSYVPTIISQTADRYSQILPLLDPASSRSYQHIHSSSPTSGAEPLGFHLEGPFLSPSKPGCHPPENLQLTRRSARGSAKGLGVFEEVYGGEVVGRKAAGGEERDCVRLVTLAPEVDGVGEGISKLVENGWVVSVGHSAASTEQAVQAVADGATLITHLFNAMPQLHHREPGIIGLLGLPTHLPPPNRPSMPRHISQNVRSGASTPVRKVSARGHARTSSSLTRIAISSSPEKAKRVDLMSPPESPEEEESPLAKALTELAGATISPIVRKGSDASSSSGEVVQEEREGRPLQFGEVRRGKERKVKRPYWSIITDGVHVHPMAVNMAYRAHEEGCVLVTDAVQLMDPHLPDGKYPWRDSTSIVKSGSSITLENTSTLAGAAVPLDECVRNLSRFANIPLSQAIKCATRHPAEALGGWVERSKGRLEVGMDADLSVWDRMSGKVLGTWVGGKEVYSSA